MLETLGEEEGFGQASRHFNWEKYCYQYMSQEKKDVSDAFLKRFINENAEWTDQIRKRGRIFFEIINAWVGLIKRTFFLNVEHL